MTEPDRGLYFVFKSKENGDLETKRIINIMKEELGEFGPNDISNMGSSCHISIPDGQGFNLNNRICDNGYWCVGVTTRPGYFYCTKIEKGKISTDFEKQNQNYTKFFAFFQKCCIELKPVAGYLNNDHFFWEGIPATGSEFEYYSEPYFFAVDAVHHILPPFFQVKLNEFKYTPVFDYLTDVNVKKELGEIKKFLSLKELEEIISKHTYKTFTAPNGGIGCNKYDGSKHLFLGYPRPRFYVKEELRKRGFRPSFGYSDINYDFRNQKEQPDKGFEVFKRILNERNIELIFELSRWFKWFRPFEFNLEKSLEACKSAYKEETDPLKKNDILILWISIMGKTNQLKFPHYEDLDKYTSKLYGPYQADAKAMQKRDAALNELRDYLEKG